MMADIVKLNITSGQRQWGVNHASITWLDDKVGELEAKGMLSPMDQLVTKRLHQRLKELKEDFKFLHFTIVDLLEQQENMQMGRQSSMIMKIEVAALGIAYNSWFCRTSLHEESQQTDNKGFYTGA